MQVRPPPLSMRASRSVALAKLRRRTIAAGAACLLAFAPGAGSAVDPPAAEPREAVLATPWFRFHSDFDFNLYDVVLTSATARMRKQADPFHGECFSKLVAEERSAWDAAVGYYAATVAATADFSRERFIVRSRLAGFALEMDDDDRRDLALSLLFLDTAARALVVALGATQ